jgi:endonuclease/exonuclease/phosphatase family metal-dependent hydrolase
MRLRVVTLNVWNDEGDPRRTEVINAELRRLDPDLVALQEVLNVEQLAQLVDGTGLHGLHQEQASRVSAEVAKYGGNAIATRWPNRTAETLDLSELSATALPWRTLAVHVGLPNLGDVLFLTPTSSFWPDAEVEREREALALADLEARHRTTLPSIIAGDFNAAPDAASIRFLTGRQSLNGRSVQYHDAWTVAGAGAGHTWTHENPNATQDIEKLIRQPNHGRRIDYILVGTPHSHPDAFARVRSASLAFDKPTDGIWPSDHYGVVADLDIGLT